MAIFYKIRGAPSGSARGARRGRPWRGGGVAPKPVVGWSPSFFPLVVKYFGSTSQRTRQARRFHSSSAEDLQKVASLGRKNPVDVYVDDPAPDPDGMCKFERSFERDDRKFRDT